MDTPVLYLIFNRPDLVEITFSRIREIRPAYLFVAADGPRANYPEDAQKCELARKKVLSMIDWPCDLHTLFRDENLGCGRAVSGAISWFFEHVEEGIILEDDCLPDITFFAFCRELLDYYRDEDQVFHIGGSNLLNGRIRCEGSYYFSNYAHVWGWATWKRAWNEFRYDVSELGEINLGGLNRVLFDRQQSRYWLSIAEMLKQKDPNMWAYRWHLAILINKGISVTPTSNLVQNIGFTLDATHTTEINLSVKAEKMSFPLRRPLATELSREADKLCFNRHYSNKTTMTNHVRNFLYKEVPAPVYGFLKDVYHRLREVLRARG